MSTEPQPAATLPKSVEERLGQFVPALDWREGHCQFFGTLCGSFLLFRRDKWAMRCAFNQGVSHITGCHGGYNAHALVAVDLLCSAGKLTREDGEAFHLWWQATLEEEDRQVEVATLRSLISRHPEEAAATVKAAKKEKS